MVDVIAIIPARSGSKSIVNKNVAQFSGFPLIAYSIAVAKLLEKIDRVIVSTDSHQYAEIAQQYGAEVPFLRPEKYSTDLSTDREFLVHAMNWFSENEGYVPEYWVHLRPTTPLRLPSIVDLAIDEILSDKNATSLRSGHKAPESPLKWFRKDKTGCFKGLLDIDAGNEAYNLPKESFETVYIPDGYVDVVRASHVLNNKTIHGERMLGFESPVCAEIDSPEEFDYIQYQLERDGSPLVDYLKIINKEGC